MTLKQIYCTVLIMLLCQRSGANLTEQDISTVRYTGGEVVRCAGTQHGAQH